MKHQIEYDMTGDGLAHCACKWVGVPVKDGAFVRCPVEQAAITDSEPTTVPGRNDPCWCGSGKKYKKCHGR